MSVDRGRERNGHYTTTQEVYRKKRIGSLGNATSEKLPKGNSTKQDGQNEHRAKA